MTHLRRLPDTSPGGAAYSSTGRESGVSSNPENQVPEGRQNPLGGSFIREVRSPEENSSGERSQIGFPAGTIDCPFTPVILSGVKGFACESLRGVERSLGPVCCRLAEPRSSTMNPGGRRLYREPLSKHGVSFVFLLISTMKSYPPQLVHKSCA